MKDLLKRIGWLDILRAILFGVIGVFMIVKTDLAITIISYIVGTLFVISGIIKIVDYFLAKGSYDFYNYDLVYGIIAIIIGIITIICSDAIEYIFRIMIGSWIIYSGILRLSLSIKLHKAQINIWGMSLMLSIIMILVGIYILFMQGALVLTIGIIMLVYSIIDLIESIIFKKYVKELL